MDDSVELLRVLGNKFSAEILQAADEPKSAQELSDELDIPIATSYRRIEELTDAELLELQGKEFSDEGRRTQVYRRNVETIRIEFGEGTIEFRIEERPEVSDALADVWEQLGKR
ncbi:MAG: helix-turn-helix domain-containing protein [Halobacteriales archaeon]|nr:helix-turn-helix domain-containing protein [Halobacteriales archaeon]